MRRHAMVIFWPSFLVAIVQEGFFFSLLDPHELAQQYAGFDLPPLGLYTIGFFCFWLFTSLAGMLTYYLAFSPDDTTGSRL